MEVRIGQSLGILLMNTWFIRNQKVMVYLETSEIVQLLAGGLLAIVLWAGSRWLYRKYFKA